MAVISSKGMYGLAAMYELYTMKSSKPVQIKEISSKANIPQNYLEQLLNQLRKADLVKSVRGAHGGYLLSRDAALISVKEILEVLEGNLQLADTKTNSAALDLFWKESNEQLKTIFDLSLADLEAYQQKIYEQMVYTI